MNREVKFLEKIKKKWGGGSGQVRGGRVGGSGWM